MIIVSGATVDLGLANDSHSVTSMFGKVNQLLEDAHSAQMCYPTLANPVTVTGAAGSWVIGALTEIVPASTITSDFDIHFVNLSAVSANDEYEIHLYYGAGDTFACCVPFTKSATSDPVGELPTKSPLIPANSRVRAGLASAGGGSDTANIKIIYHEY